MPETVSIAVTTYNSAHYLVETLNSIIHQTYRPLELIVSDDSSIDGTVEIAREWLSNPEHQNYFVRTQLITVPQNTGTSANCNRCIAASQTEWIKFIAGDDILLPNCIEDNMKFTKANPAAQVVFSQVLLYADRFDEKYFLRYNPASYPDNLMNSAFTAEDQWKILLQSDRINYTPSYFFHKAALAQVGNYDESDRLIEDYPMWLKLTHAGIRMYYFHKPTVGYRIHQKATNNVGSEVLFKPSAINGYRVRKKYAHPYLPLTQIWQERWGYNISLLFQFLGLNRNKMILKQLYRLLMVYTNPFVYINALKKRLTLFII